MSTMRRIGLVTLLFAGAGVAFAAFAWLASGPSGPGRRLVGVWEIASSRARPENAVAATVQKTDPAVANTLGEKMRSTERIHFDRKGSCRHVQSLLGLTITSMGDWSAIESDEGKLLVTFHKTKLLLENPNGEPKEQSQDVEIKWILSEVNPDEWSLSTTTDEGQIQQYTLRRSKD